MKKNLLLLTALVAPMLTMSAAKIKIDRIEPTDWFVGMKNPTVQLMVYGQGIRDVQRVTTDYPGAVVDSLVRLDSPNYLLVYMNLRDARPGTMKLTFSAQRSTLSVDYQLKQREKSGGERRGFTNADVLYMLMPDRFAQGRGHNPQVKGLRPYREDRSQPSLRHGGDLNGIREHLDYFCDLGVTALWLTPVLENNSPDDPRGYSTYHGYATTNYYRVDPRFGTNDDYRRLCDEAHGKGLKVVMDMIFNHSGLEHPWIADLPSKDWLNLKTSPSPSEGGDVKAHDSSSGDQTPPPSEGLGEAYILTSYKLTPVLDPYASEVDRRETVEGWFVPTMPDLNQHNPHLMRYLIQNSKWWIETVGIDGIRMDTYPYAFADAMADWMKEIDDEYPNFNTVGETWVTEPAYTAAWQSRVAWSPKLGDNRGLNKAPSDPQPPNLGGLESYLKTVMDFSFYDRINRAATEETDGWFAGLNLLYNSFVYDYLYPNPSSVMAFIENHDTDRFLKNGRDTLMLKQALALLLTVNRIPQLYYGTEILMNGTKEVTDGNVRKDFPGGFPGDTHNAFTREGRTRQEQSMFQWLSRLLHWRQGNTVITQGRQTQFIPYQGVYVIARRAATPQHSQRAELSGGQRAGTVLTVLNGTTKPAVMQVKRYAEVIGQATRARDVLTGRYYDLSRDVELKPRQSLVLEF